jgi:lysophospholipase L1-like esterase
MVGYQPLPEYDSADSAAWRTLAAILTAWARECPRLLIVPLPIYYYTEGISTPSYQTRLAEWQLQTGGRVADPLPEFLQHSLNERRGWRFPRDHHPTPEGHAAIARALKPALAKALEEAASGSLGSPPNADGC